MRTGGIITNNNNNNNNNSINYYYTGKTLDHYVDQDDPHYEEAHTKLHAPPDFTGPINERYCTDILCLCLLLLGWIIMSILGVYALSYGDYRWIIYPMDYSGNVCGVHFKESGVNMTDYPYLYYVNYYTGGVCVKSCPNLSLLSTSSSSSTDSDNGTTESNGDNNNQSSSTSIFIGWTTNDGLTDMKTLITYSGIWQTTDGLAELSMEDVQTLVSPYYYTLSYTTTTDVGTNTNNNNNNTTTTDNNGTTTTTNSTTSSSSSSPPPICTTDSCYPNNNVIESYTSNGINEGYGYAYYLTDTYEWFGRCYITKDAENRVAELVGVGGDGGDGTEGTTTTTTSTNTTTTNNMMEDGSSYNNFPSSFGTMSSAIGNSSTSTFFTNMYGDLWESRMYIVGFGFGISLLVSIIYMGLLRTPCLLTGLVWCSIIAVIALFVFAGYFAYTTAQDWKVMDPPPVHPEQIDYTEYASYVLFGIAAILTVIAICLRSQIQLATTVVQHAGAAMNSMVFVLLIPILQFGGLLAFWFVWAVYSIYLASMGNIGTQTFAIPGSDDVDVTIRVYEYDDFTTYCGWFLLFIFLWTASFIVAMGDMMIAMATSKWYFTVNRRGINSCTVLASIWTVCRYHMGTCAYGSLILAIVKLIRAIITKFQRKVTQYTNPTLAACIFCCCQCCICCVERCLQFINKNAYIQCAILGTPFCESGRKAFFLIVRNADRIGAVSYVSGMVLVIGKLFISVLTTALSYYFLVEYMEIDYLNSYAGPVLAIFIISYFVADMFMDVFEISILTVLHCFVADEEMFDGRARYADGSLTDWIDKHADIDGNNDRPVRASDK